MGNRPGAWHEAPVRILRANARFDGMAPAGDVSLRKWQAVAGRDTKHGLHDVDAGDHFGHGVLDLKPGIDLQEIIAVAADDEFDRTDATIAEPVPKPDGILKHPFAKRGRQVGGGGFLNQLLMTTLQRAFALKQMDDVALAVSGDLHFDVTALLDEFFDNQSRVAEGTLRLPHRRFDFLVHAIEGRDRPHALAAAAGCRFQHDGQAEATHRPFDLPGICAWCVAAGDGRYAGGHGFALGGGLVAEALDRLRRGTDEGEAGRLDRAGEGGVLGQKAKSGMNGFGPDGPGGRHDGIDPQVAV
jgi:hypothetical protein